MGVYAVGQTIVLGASIFARFGMNNSLMKAASYERNNEKKILFLRVALKKSLQISFVFSVFMILFRKIIEDVFEYQGLSLLIVGLAVSLPFFTAGFVFSGFFKGVRMPATACFLENGIVSFFTAAILLGVFGAFSEINIESVGWAYAFSAFIVFLVAIVKAGKWGGVKGRGGIHLNENEKSEFWEDSKNFFVMSMSGFLQSVLLILIAGLLMDGEQLGVFRVAQQVATLIAFVLIVINAIYPPRFAFYYNNGDIEKLEKSAKEGALVGAVYSLPLLIACWAFSDEILSFFGDDFEGAALLLKIISFAQLVNVTTGAVGFVLNMTGYSHLMRNLVLVCGAVGILLFCIMVPLWGALGAAISLSFVLVVQNVSAVFLVRRKLGFWPIPTIKKWWAHE